MYLLEDLADRTHPPSGSFCPRPASAALRGGCERSSENCMPVYRCRARWPQNFELPYLYLHSNISKIWTHEAKLSLFRSEMRREMAQWIKTSYNLTPLKLYLISHKHIGARLINRIVLLRILIMPKVLSTFAISIQYMYICACIADNRVKTRRIWLY